MQGLSPGTLSPVEVSDLAPGSVVYDCRPPLLPVTVQLRGPLSPCVVHPAASSSLAAPPADDVVGTPGPDPTESCVPLSVTSDDPGMYLEDELCRTAGSHFFSFVPMSPSRYPAPAVPAGVPSVGESQMAPPPFRVVNALPSIDAFPTYSMSPAVSYGPVTSLVTPELCVTRESSFDGSVPGGL